MSGAQSVGRNPNYASRLGSAPTLWIDEWGSAQCWFQPDFRRKTSISKDSPEKIQLFRTSSPGLDARRLEKKVYSINEQAGEQVNE